MGGWGGWGGLALDGHGDGEEQDGSGAEKDASGRPPREPRVRESGPQTAAGSRLRSRRPFGREGLEKVVVWGGRFPENGFGKRSRDRAAGPPPAGNRRNRAPRASEPSRVSRPSSTKTTNTIITTSSSSSRRPSPASASVTIPAAAGLLFSAKVADPSA